MPTEYKMKPKPNSKSIAQKQRAKYTCELAQLKEEVSRIKYQLQHQPDIMPFSEYWNKIVLDEKERRILYIQNEVKLIDLYLENQNANIKVAKVKKNERNSESRPTGKI